MARRQCSCINNGPELMAMNVDTKHLPLEVLELILLRLPVESLCCIRCVSKAMLTMVDSNSFVTLHTRSLVTSSTHDSVPHLMCFSRFHDRPKTPQGYVEVASLQSLKYDGDTTFTQGKHALTFFKSHPSDDHTYKVEFVFYNLFCLRSIEVTSYRHCFLVDPLRGEIMRLPACDIQDPNVKYGSDRYGMGFDSLTGTY